MALPKAPYHVYRIRHTDACAVQTPPKTGPSIEPPTRWPVPPTPLAFPGAAPNTGGAA